MNKTHIKDFFFLREEDRKGVTDSLLLDSGQEILSGTIDGITVSVRVEGEVDIDWKGRNYRRPSEFPEDLKKAIRKGTLGHDKRAYVINNNWFEVIVEDENGQHLQEDVIDLDLSTMSEEEGRTLLLDIVEDYLADHPEKMTRI